MRFVTQRAGLGGALLVAAATVGCDGSNDRQRDAEAPDESVSDAGASNDAAFEEPEGCIALDANTVGVWLDLFRDDWTGSCQTSRQRDAAFTWTAPAAGRYVFHAESERNFAPPPRPISFTGSARSEDSEGGVSPVVFVLDGTCGGSELVCSRDNVLLDDATRTTVIAKLESQQMVTVVLDVPDDIASRAGEYYTATLRIEPVACGTVELSGEDSVHHEVDIDSLRAPIGPVSCASGTRNRVEFSWAFRALVAGHYVATLHAAGGGSGPVALAVFDESCFEERACAEGDSAVATLPLDLEAGEVVAWVASAMGSIGEESPHFELDIERQP